jgi:NADH:ubiquinone oxidoreductase subunit 4 (subunit M)
LIGSFSMIVGIIALVGAAALVSSYMLVLITILMCIKIPTFPFNFWLIEVHAEANTSLSLVLAALMLKVGVFGLLKYC